MWKELFFLFITMGDYFPISEDGTTQLTSLPETLFKIKKVLEMARVSLR